MRHSFLTFILASGIALAADGPQAVTYLQGNVDGLAPNATATLEVTHGKAMILRASDADINIPYAGISRATVAPYKVEEAKQPMYKVWTLRKKLIPPPPMEQVTVQYKAGTSDRTVTLSMEKTAADRVMAAWTEENDRRAKARGEWWGDAYWRTAHNKGQWAEAGEVASRE